MGEQNLEHLDDEELLSLFEATGKLLPNPNDESPVVTRKTESVKKKLSLLEQEMRLRSLWDGDEGE